MVVRVQKITTIDAVVLGNIATTVKPQEWILRLAKDAASGMYMISAEVVKYGPTRAYLISTHLPSDEEQARYARSHYEHTLKQGGTLQIDPVTQTAVVLPKKE